MHIKSFLFIALSFLTATLYTAPAWSDIEWSGVLRLEGVGLSNPELGSKRSGGETHGHKSINYALTHLVLRPKIVAGDGVTIYGQFDVFNNSAYPNSQLGSYWGTGVRTGNPPGASAENSNVLTRTQGAQSLTISQLYMTMNQEFGSLIVGRVPIHFGLGSTHNAGRGLFDHWYEMEDLIGYKVVLGNLYILPMFGKVSEGVINQSDDLSDVMVQVQYENPETDIELGVFHQVRSGGDQASDAPSGSPGVGLGDARIGGTGATSTGSVSIKNTSVYALKDTDRFRLGVEATFQSGTSGVMVGGNNVTMEGFGVASEVEWRPEASRWKWGLKAGVATGDDPNTATKFEGFFFNRNYDVAMLMFNHPLGVYDALRTGVLTGDVGHNGNNASKDINAPDVETISNVVYFAPSAKYTFNDRWTVSNTLAAGWVIANPSTDGKDPGKSLGYEWDLALNFAPYKGVMWVNQLGVMLPGEVWQDGGQYDANMTFGFVSKASISF